MNDKELKALIDLDYQTCKELKASKEDFIAISQKRIFIFQNIAIYLNDSKTLKKIDNAKKYILSLYNDY